ncbi:hypothetical protein [Metabacillus litoralis]|nr:hypothetical protein [Metabacillus litoralis]
MRVGRRQVKSGKISRDTGLFLYRKVLIEDFFLFIGMLVLNDDVLK